MALPPLEDRRKVKEDVGKDRVHITQATIVRIMKSRRIMKHGELLIEVVGQTQKMFAADVKLVKKQIESLIEVRRGWCCVRGLARIAVHTA